MSSRPLIHIGYHKTGSTWLQKNLFSNPAAGLYRACAFREIMEYFVAPHPLEFNPDHCQQEMQRRLQQDGPAGLQVPVLSAERLSGNPQSGGYDNKEIADRLHTLFPQGRVLVLIRRQPEMILSCYKQYLVEGGRCSLKRYLTVPPDYRVPLFDPGFLEYHRLIRYYQTLFGPENILVLPFELFLEDPVELVKKILQLVDRPLPPNLPFNVRQNPSLSLYLLRVKRWLNAWGMRNTLNPSGRTGILNIHTESFYLVMQALRRMDSLIPAPLRRRKDRRAVSEIRDRLDASGYSEAYRKSNQETSVLIGQDLKHYGYVM